MPQYLQNIAIIFLNIKIEHIAKVEKYSLFLKREI